MKLPQTIERTLYIEVEDTAEGQAILTDLMMKLVEYRHNSAKQNLLDGVYRMRHNV